MSLDWGGIRLRAVALACATLVSACVVDADPTPLASQPVSATPRPSVSQSTHEPSATPEPTATVEPSPTPDPLAADEVLAAAGETALGDLEIPADTTQGLIGAPPESEFVRFVEYVATDVDEFWRRAFADSGLSYQSPTLHVIDRVHQTECRLVLPGEGPLYCPDDAALIVPFPYLAEIDFDDPGDFSLAYVVAHEMGHHVQSQLGLTSRYLARRAEVDGEITNEVEKAELLRQLSIGNEIQADCLAGVWANYVWQTDRLEDTDLNEAIDLAISLGDDVLPNSAKDHGTAEQRSGWLRTGYDSGTADSCNTYGGRIDAGARQSTVNAVRLKRYFRAIRNQCEITASVELTDPLSTASCPYTVGADGSTQFIRSYFFLWSSPTGMQAKLDAIVADNSGAVRDVWWYGAAQSDPQGTIIRFVDAGGAAWIVWTHDEALMMGQGTEALFGDPATLFSWWSSTGASHRDPTP